MPVGLMPVPVGMMPVPVGMTMPEPVGMTMPTLCQSAEDSRDVAETY